MSLQLVTFNTGVVEARKCEWLAALPPYFELIDKYEAPQLNLQLDEFKAVFSQKKATGAFNTPQLSQKAPKK
jgi:hypothetical protein